jgi:hypothetical protein
VVNVHAVSVYAFLVIKPSGFLSLQLVIGLAATLL